MVQEGARVFRDWSENSEASHHWGVFKTVYLICFEGNKIWFKQFRFICKLFLFLSYKSLVPDVQLSGCYIIQACTNMSGRQELAILVT